jgi:hypothetical protein
LKPHDNIGQVSHGYIVQYFDGIEFYPRMSAPFSMFVQGSANNSSHIRTVSIVVKGYISSEFYLPFRCRVFINEVNATFNHLK